MMIERGRGWVAARWSTFGCVISYNPRDWGLSICYKRGYRPTVDDPLGRRSMVTVALLCFSASAWVFRPGFWSADGSVL